MTELYQDLFVLFCLDQKVKGLKEALKDEIEWMLECKKERKDAALGVVSSDCFTRKLKYNI